MDLIRQCVLFTHTWSARCGSDAIARRWAISRFISVAADNRCTLCMHFFVINSFASIDYFCLYTLFVHPLCTKFSFTEHVLNLLSIRLYYSYRLYNFTNVCIPMYNVDYYYVISVNPTSPTTL